MERSVAPPMLHAATWSASISENFHIRFALASCPTAQSGQFETPFLSAAAVCFA